jgi:transcriptional regulator with XRE-family HTH domain
MTAGQLMRAARTRAGLSQQEVATRVGVPRSQIARWEADGVDPGFAAVRRVLLACGFDLPMVLESIGSEGGIDDPRALQWLTPRQRLDRALTLGAVERSDFRFDPYAVLGQIQPLGTDAIVVGALARTLRGADEVPHQVDLLIRKDGLTAADEALRAIGSRSPGTTFREGDTWVYLTPHGRIVVHEPARRTPRFRDLWRRGEPVDLGRSLRPTVAATSDLLRMAQASHDHDAVRRLDEIRKHVDT